MSTIATTPTTDGLELSRAPQWVLHHVMVEHVRRAYEEATAPPWWAVSVAGKLESTGAAGPTPGTGAALGSRLTTFEAWRIRTALVEYVEESELPEPEASLAAEIVDAIDHTFEAAPQVIR